MRSARHIALICAALLAPPAWAQDSIEAFYRDKAIDLYVPSTPGGAYDVYGRLVGRFLGRHVPGNPAVVVRNMPGASGMQMLNFLQSSAPRDGSAIGMPPPQAALNQIFGMAGVRYDARQYAWLFRIAPVVDVLFTWHTSPTRTAHDLFTRQTVIGAVGPSSIGAIYANQLNTLLDAKIKMVVGYPGTSETLLAIERGEVEGTTKPWAGIKAENGDWLRSGKLNLLLAFLRERHAELPDTPTLPELARTDLDRRVFRFLATAPSLGRAFATTPAAPAARVAALRAAFMAMAKDAEYLKEAERLTIDLGPLEGGALQALVDEAFSHAPDAVQRAKEASGL